MKQIEKAALLNDLFDAYYTALYEYLDAIDVQEAAAVLSDALVKIPSIKKDFDRLVKYRQDFILSDREYAAFLLAYHDATDAIKRIEAKERTDAQEVPQKIRGFCRGCSFPRTLETPGHCLNG